MTVRVGINGFGRIGRVVMRAALARKDIEIVHINDLSSPATSAHLLKYDSVHGTLNEDVRLEGDNVLVVGDRKITLSAIKDPTQLPWKEKKVDIVFESTGRFRKKEDAMMHIQAGAKKVLISAPAEGEDLTVVYGVNQDKLNDSCKIVSNASCTTNCLAPVAKVINDAIKINKGIMTTIHSYTNDQVILDFPHKDLRRARAAALSMIPTSTGAAQAVGKVIPELQGKFKGLSVRVPTPNVSLVDVVFELERETSVEEINSLLKKASEGSLKGILGYTDLPLVSSDFNGCNLSSIVDGSCTTVLGNTVKILSWYDNETGYSTRMLDVAKLMA